MTISTPPSLPGSAYHPSDSLPDSQTPLSKSNTSLDILLDSDCLILRGTGIDTEPATLRGSLVLHLAEATSFKDIILHFRGKSRIPTTQIRGEGPSVISSNYQTNVFFTHNSSVLEGDLKHPPTLKAGRHLFPFQLQLDSSLPSSLAAHGGLFGVNYKLHATAVRSVFAVNLHASTCIRLIRSFTPEAFEYHQALEIENTWTQKFMYSLVVPHVAWAAGDTILTLVKFSPLLKGVRIRSITTTVEEELGINAKSGGLHENIRVIAKAKHKICDGCAVALRLTDSKRTHSRTTSMFTPRSPAAASSASNGSRTSASGNISIDDSQLGRMSDLRTPQESISRPEYLDPGSEEVITTLSITLPESTTPSHAIQPFFVNHRIRWRIHIGNPDGHVSELLCSQSIHILDHAVFDEARLATLATRRLLGSPEDAQRLDEMELPSYPAHVLDCIANAYAPETLPISGNHGTQASDSSSSSLSAPTTPVNVVRSVSPELRRFSRSRVPTPASSRPSSSASGRTVSRTASPERRHFPQCSRRFSLRPFTKVLNRHSSPDPSPSPTSHDPPHNPAADLNHALSEVPHYDVASRGFLGGGVIPLSSLLGLPSYEQVGHSGDLVSRT